MLTSTSSKAAPSRGQGCVSIYALAENMKNLHIFISTLVMPGAALKLGKSLEAAKRGLKKPKELRIEAQRCGYEYFGASRECGSMMQKLCKTDVMVG